MPRAWEVNKWKLRLEVMERAWIKLQVGGALVTPNWVPLPQQNNPGHFFPNQKARPTPKDK